MDPSGQTSPDTQPTENHTTAQQFDATANSLISGAASPARSTQKRKYTRKHNTLTLAEKYGIILRLEQGETSTALSREFNIGRSTIHDMRLNRDSIEKFVTSPAYSLHKRRTLKKGDFPELEEALYDWYNEERSKIHITGDVLKERGKYLFNMIYQRDDFQASEGWLDKFKKRFGIRLSDRIPAEFLKSPSPVELDGDYGSKFLKIVEQQKLLPDQVYFAFGGSINCTDLPAGVSQAFRPRILNAAFMPCVNVTGRHKLDLLVVGNHQLGSNVSDLADYVVQENTRISATILQEWYLEKFVPSVIKYLKKQKLPRKSLLIVANDSSFPDEADMKIKTADGVMDVMLVPQFSADIFQDMGRVLISTLKTFYKKRLLMDLLSKPFTRIDNVMQKYSVKEAVCNLVYAWQGVPSGKLANYWLQIWQATAYSPEFKSSSANGDLGNVEADIEAIISLFCSRQIPSSGNRISPEELRAWLTVDFKTEPDDRAWPDNQALPDSSSDSTVSCEEAVSAVNTLLKWAEEQGVEGSDVLALKTFQEKVLISSFHYNHSSATISIKKCLED